MSIDDFDRKILGMLQRDSSTPYVDIAEKLEVTDGTIHQRIKKLKKMGAITRFTVKLNQDIVGVNALAYASITVNPGFIDSVADKISQIPSILEVHEVHTRGDLLVKVRASNQSQIRDILVNEIRTIDGVIDSEVFPVYKKWKEETTIPLEKSSRRNESKRRIKKTGKPRMIKKKKTKKKNDNETKTIENKK